MNIDLLEKNEFFIGLKAEEIGKILESVKYSFEEYKRGSVIANEEEECSSIGLILEGVIEIQRIYPSGNSIIVKRLKCGDVFGEALVFSKESTYPATIISTTDSKILFVNKNEILRLCLREEKILENFVSLLSDKVFMLNNKVKSLALSNDTKFSSIFSSLKHNLNISFLLTNKILLSVVDIIVAGYVLSFEKTRASPKTSPHFNLFTIILLPLG